MASKATTITQYLGELPQDRKQIVTLIYATIKKNLPKGFEDCINYGMIGFVVPLSTYPNGYHCAPGTPLPFLNIASTKSHIAIYHMGLYSSKPLFDWFTSEWTKHSSKKLDIGKSCIRFKKPEDVPIELIGELAKKITPKQWIEMYESVINSR